MRLAYRKPSEQAPPRMTALATLPVFLSLEDRRAIVAGGSAAAAWKAELLAAAGADVRIFATEASSEMESLLVRGAAQGTLTLHECSWSADALAGAAIAVADAEDDEEAAAFFDAARAAGVVVNVIDKPAYCQFQFGAIVNRSPVVVGISTTGAAPILGQAIRRRIETLLPPALALWGQLANGIRAQVGARLPAAAARRAFWEKFVDCAFGPVPPRDAAAQLDRLIDRISTDGATTGGRVTLVEVIEGSIAVLEFGGGCQGCSAVDITLKQGVEARLLEEIPELTAIKDATDHTVTEHAYYR